MATPQRDDPATDPAFGPGGALPSPAPRTRRLTVVPFDPARAAPSAEDWVAALRLVADQRDRDAFGRLFTHFAPRVKSFLIRTGSTDELAEELAQEALVTVWRKATLFDPA